MKYIIGIDGGGTKTHAVLTDLEGNKLAGCFGGPSNFLIQGTEKVSTTLFELINEVISRVNIGWSDIKGVCLGTTGAGRRNDAELLENAFINFLHEKNISLNLFRVESDARISLEGSFSGNPGSILIAGTGSIMFGKDKLGNIHRVGGFGRYLGDEGSGYAIGKKGLIAVSKAFDGRGEKTLISELVSGMFNISSTEDLITEIYKNQFDIASAAPVVIKAAEQNDSAALKIVEDETNELILHLRAMYAKLNERVMNVSFTGGLICNENIYSKIFRDKIFTQLPFVNIKDADYPPEMGAVFMAINLLKKIQNEN